MMKARKQWNRRHVIWLLAVATGVAIATGVVINGGAAPYNGLSNVAGTTIGTEFEIRNAGLT